MAAIDLELYAILSAELAEGARSAREILGAFALDEAAWVALCADFGAQLAQDAGGDGARVLAFSAAYAAHQDRLRPVPPLTVEQWVALEADVDAYDAPAAALAAHGLTLADYFRLIRRWAPALARDPALAARADAARASLEAAEPPFDSDAVVEPTEPRGAHQR